MDIIQEYLQKVRADIESLRKIETAILTELNGQRQKKGNSVSTPAIIEDSAKSRIKKTEPAIAPTASPVITDNSEKVVFSPRLQELFDQAYKGN